VMKVTASQHGHAMFQTSADLGTLAAAERQMG
jgi:hypothetical protein